MTDEQAAPIRLEYRSAPVRDPRTGFSDLFVFLMAGVLVPLFTSVAVVLVLIACAFAR